MSSVLRKLLVPGAIALLPLVLIPARTEAQSTSGWEPHYDAAWARANTYYRIRAASTVTSDPSCQGDLALQARIKELVRAVGDKRYGDATRLLGEVQDKTMCLDLEGARGVEFALAGFVHRAANNLSGAPLDTAVHGALNAGTLVFDELQYTRRSWWLPMMNHHANKLAPVIARFPKAELGFFAYDWSRNTLSRAGDPSLMASSMRDFSNYGDGSCSMLEMAGAGFKCKGWAGAAGGGGKGGAGAKGGMPSVPGGGGSVSCIATAAQSSGARGQLGCAAKAIAGMTFDPRTATPQTLLAQGAAGGSPGIRDPRCALSEDAGNGGTQTDPEAAKKEPSNWEKIKDTAAKAVGIAVDVVVSVFDKTPPVISDLKPLASAEGADAVRGGLQMLQANAAREALLSDDGIKDYYDKREGRVVTDPQANKRTVDGFRGPLGGGGGGSCGRGSNAARRAHALYDCVTGGTPIPTNRGPNNPIVGMRDPDQVQTKPTGALACMVNGGDMPRASFDDPKCAAARCAQGATSCPCNQPGGPGGTKVVGGGSLTPRVSATTSPNCAEPPCGGPLPTGPLKGPVTGPGGGTRGPLGGPGVGPIGSGRPGMPGMPR